MTTTRNYELIVALAEMLESEGAISTDQLAAITSAKDGREAQAARVSASDGREPPAWARDRSRGNGGTGGGD